MILFFIQRNGMESNHPCQFISRYTTLDSCLYLRLRLPPHFFDNIFGDTTGIRTQMYAVKGRSPNQLEHGAIFVAHLLPLIFIIIISYSSTSRISPPLGFCFTGYRYARFRFVLAMDCKSIYVVKSK